MKSLYQGAASYITTEGWEADCKAKVHIAALAVFLLFALLSIFFSCSSSVSKMLGQTDQISVSGKKDETDFKHGIRGISHQIPFEYLFRPRVLRL